MWAYKIGGETNYCSSTYSLRILQAAAKNLALANVVWGSASDKSLLVSSVPMRLGKKKDFKVVQEEKNAGMHKVATLSA